MRSRCERRRATRPLALSARFPATLSSFVGGMGPAVRHQASRSPSRLGRAGSTAAVDSVRNLPGGEGGDEDEADDVCRASVAAFEITVTDLRRRFAATGWSEKEPCPGRARLLPPGPPDTLR